MTTKPKPDAPGWWFFNGAAVHVRKASTRSENLLYCPTNSRCYSTAPRGEWLGPLSAAGIAEAVGALELVRDAPTDFYCVECSGFVEVPARLAVARCPECPHCQCVLDQGDIVEHFQKAARAAIAALLPGDGGESR